MIKQSQQQKLTQKLSPQQIQLMKLLQIPTVNLEERIKEEMEENPALEYEEEGHNEGEDDYGDTDASDDAPEESGEEEVELSDDGSETIDLDDFMRAEDDGDYGGRGSDDYGPGEGMQGSMIRVETDLHDTLLAQLGMLELDERRTAIAEQIIGSMDEDGYLRREVDAIVDDLAFSRSIETSIPEVDEIIGQIQRTFDPPGVCARDLTECLLLQLERAEPQTDAVRAAALIISKYFTEFTRKHYERVQRGIGANDALFREAVTVITRLNPKPGGALALVNKAETYVTPDFFVFNNNGKLEVTLNARNAPELRVSEGYREMMRAYDRGDKKNKEVKEAVTFIKQKLDAAKWFIDAIKQRQHTLIHTMNAIVEFQREFFLTGDEAALRPMILKDIAKLTNLDVSTVSRVANSKHVQTEFGTFRLKYFFSEGLQLESGEEVSTREVKSILGAMIAAEDKRRPLSDDKLADMLAEKGYHIARRTVAKYREQLNVPVARLRRGL